MPVIRDLSGRSVYVPEDRPLVERPADFLSGAVYAERLELARHIILDVIRHNRVLPAGKGFNPEVQAVTGTYDTSSLIDFINNQDARRSLKVRAQNRHGHDTSFGYRGIKSPQDINRRRRRLFSLDDVSVLFYDANAIKRKKYEPFLDLMRWHVLHDALLQMIDQHEIEFIDGTWLAKVTIIDERRGCGRRKRKRKIKHDNRSYHGRPQRDRLRAYAA